MKRSMLLVAVALAVAGPALARPCRGCRRCGRSRDRARVVRCCRHRGGHCWHGSDWGKFAAGAAIGWMANEACAPRRAVVRESRPVCSVPVVRELRPVCSVPVVRELRPVYRVPVVRRPVVETVVISPVTSGVSVPSTSFVYGTPPPVAAYPRDPAVVIRRISY